jgi:hypothetical protein
MAILIGGFPTRRKVPVAIELRFEGSGVERAVMRGQFSRLRALVEHGIALVRCEQLRSQTLLIEDP